MPVSFSVAPPRSAISSPPRVYNFILIVQRAIAPVRTIFIKRITSCISFFCIKKLRQNYHTIKFILLKCFSYIRKVVESSPLSNFSNSGPTASSSHRWPGHPRACLPSLWVGLLWPPPVNGTVCDPALCAWPLSLSIASPRLGRVTSAPFILRQTRPQCTETPSFVYQSVRRWTPGLFPLFGYYDSRCRGHSFLRGHMLPCPLSDISGSHGNTVERLTQRFSRPAAPVSVLTSSARGLQLVP